MSKLLTSIDYENAACELDCEIAAIKAVSYVESGGRSGFMRDGVTPKILFEGHWFHKLTNGVYTTSENRDISYPKWIRTYYRMNQHQRLDKAVQLDRKAALQSASWGKFQVMGFNYKLCGFNTVQGFINAMYRSEGDHLMAFIAFVKHRRLDDELRRRDWSGFAYGYNGAGFAKNKYDEKLERAYNNYNNDLEWSS